MIARVLKALARSLFIATFLLSGLFLGLFSGIVRADQSREQYCELAQGEFSSNVCTCSALRRVINPLNEGDRQACATAQQERLQKIISMGEVAAQNDPVCVACEAAAAPVKSNPKLVCPLVTIDDIATRGRRGSLFNIIGSPSSQCSGLQDKTFHSPADLESALSTDPDFGFGAPPDLLTKAECLGSNKALPDPAKKQAVSDYYYYFNRLRLGEFSKISTISAINSTLGKPPLEGISQCQDPSLSETQDLCSQLSSCPRASSSVSQLASETWDAIQLRWDLENKKKEILAHPRGVSIDSSGANPKAEATATSDQTNEIANIDLAIEVIENLYPWLSGKEFKKTVIKTQADVESTLNRQLLANRNEAIKDLGDFRQSTTCLNSPFLDFSCANLNDTVDKAPEILPSIPSVDATPQLKSKQAQLNDLLNQADCRFQIGREKNASDQYLLSTGLDLATLVIPVFGPDVMGLKIAAGLRAAQIARVTAQVAGASAQLANGIKTASSVCHQLSTEMSPAPIQTSSHPAPSCTQGVDLNSPQLMGYRGCLMESLFDISPALLAGVPNAASMLSNISKTLPKAAAQITSKSPTLQKGLDAFSKYTQKNLTELSDYKANIRQQGFSRVFVKELTDSQGPTGQIAVTKPVSFTSDLLISSVYFGQLQPALDGAANIVNHHQADGLISNDYRFDDINTAVKNGTISRAVARKATDDRLFESNSYLAMTKVMSRQQPPPTPAEQAQAFFTNKNTAPLFATIGIHLVAPLSQWLKENPAFMRTGSAPEQLSQEQILDLYEKISKNTFVLSQIPKWFGAHPDLSDLKTDPNARDLYNQIKDDPFTKKLAAKIDSQKNPKEFAYRLQENYDWQTKFDEWKILGVSRRKLNQDRNPADQDSPNKKPEDKYTSMPLTQTDIQAETLSGLSDDPRTFVH